MQLLVQQLKQLALSTLALVERIEDDNISQADLLRAVDRISDDAINCFLRVRVATRKVIAR